ncbi:unnamed protein product, partial [Coregonus sp. 'balchen']
MLEVVVRHHIGHKDDRTCFNSDAIQTKSTNITQKLLTKSQQSVTEVVCPSHGTLSSFEASDTHPTTTQRSIWSHKRSHSQQDQQPLHSFLDNDRKRQTRRLGGPNPLLANDEDNKTARDGPPLIVQSQRMVTGLTELSPADPMRESQQPCSTPGKGSDEDGFERALKELILGSSTSCFSAEWRSQEFHILRHTGSEIWDCTEGRIGSPLRLRPSSAARTKCLALATAEILWRAGEGKKATIA